MAASTIADEPTRRDFLFIATGAMGVAAAGFVAWPLIDQMSPDATTLAASSTEVDIANIAEGQIVTVNGAASRSSSAIALRRKSKTRVRFP